MNYDELSLNQVAGLIPCSPLTLYRRCQKAPHTCPPFTKPGRVYVFRAEEVQRWLSLRDAIRKTTLRPWLRWVAA